MDGWMHWHYGNEKWTVERMDVQASSIDVSHVEAEALRVLHRSYLGRQNVHVTI